MFNNLEHLNFQNATIDLKDFNRLLIKKIHNKIVKFCLI